MECERHNAPFGRWLHKILGVVAVLLFQVPLSRALAQEQVAPVPEWLATVDEATQQIVLSWRPSSDTLTLGYHICTGSPCVDYDTVFGRLDTTYVCLSHDPTEAHLYRIHVFDSAYNVSSLTPAFGNMVLTAEVPYCSTEVNVSWTPCTGMVRGVATYRLLVQREPMDDDYELLYTTDSTGPYAFSFGLPAGVTRARLKVEALSFPDSLTGVQLRSLSNIVTAERRTVDTAAYFEVATVEYDSLAQRNIVTFHVDTAFHAAPYVLWRSVDGRPWEIIDTLDLDQIPPVYIDSDLNIFDSLHCYRLTVSDACGVSVRQSEARCVGVPDPPQPAADIPNVIVCGDAANGTFRPRVQGLKGDLYELTIYNRMGQQVCHTTDPDAGWTPAASVPQGAYTYFLRCRYNTNSIKTYSGTIIVIK